MTLKHVIFDCDGVLVDSEPLSMRADVLLLQRFGIEMSEAEAHTRFVGTTFQAMLDMMTVQYGTQFPANLHAVKNRMVEELYHQELKIVAGVKDTLAALKARGLALSVGSNSPKQRVQLSLQLTGISQMFGRIISYEDVTHGKPAPDIFLKAAELAGTTPEQCLVVEDSLTGTTAAVAAGMRTIGFTGTHADPAKHAKDLRRVGAAATLARMDDLIHHL